MERGEQSRGEVVRVDVGRELPVGMCGSQSIADGGCPPIKPGRDEGSGLGVALGQLTTERSKWATPLSFGALRFADHHVPPVCDSVRAAERLPLLVDDRVGLVVDDRLHEFVLVGEVVVRLRAADSRRRVQTSNVVPATPRSWIRAAAAATIRARVRAPLGVSLGRSLVSLTMHRMVAGFLSLTTQSRPLKVSRTTRHRHRRRLALLYACASPEAEMLAVTCTAGNVDAPPGRREHARGARAGGPGRRRGGPRPRGAPRPRRS